MQPTFALRNIIYAVYLITLHCKSDNEKRENAVIFILCRNSDADGIVSSIKTFEDTFNARYGYPYVFLNDDDFTDEFKAKINDAISTKAEFGKVNAEQWGPPPNIDMSRATKAMYEMQKKGIIYGGSLSYRNMCRFFSGQFYRHELVKKYDYYWRIEPNVKFFCKMNYDPFKYLRENKKKYGFVISLKEFMETIPTLWKTTIDFLIKHRNLLSNNEIMSYILDDKKNYNGCHYWTNFEIASFDFFRNYVYEKYFEFLDEAGGFYYERWGDAPVHSIAASLFLNKNEIHYFSDIGYEHSVYKHCPKSPSRLVECNCEPRNDIEDHFASCIKDYIKESL